MIRPHPTPLRPALLTLAALFLAGGAATAAQEAQKAPADDSLPPGAVARLGNTNFWHGAAIHSLAFAPGDKLLASHGEDNAICLWDADGKLLRRLPLPAEPIAPAMPNRITFAGPTLLFSGDARALALADLDNHLYRVFEAAGGKELCRVPFEIIESEEDLFGGVRPPAGPKAFKRGFAGPFILSHNAGLLVMRGKEDCVVVRDLNKGTERYRLKGHEGEVTALAIAADGKTLLTGGADRTVRLWDLKKGKEIRAFHGHRARLLDVAFLPDGRRLLSASADGTLRIWDRSTGKQLLRATWLSASPLNRSLPSVLARALASVPSAYLWHDAAGKQVGCLYADGPAGESFRRFDADTGKEIGRTFTPAVATVSGSSFTSLSSILGGGIDRTTAFGRERKLLARGTASHHIELLDLDTGERVGDPRDGGAAVSEVAVAGRLLAFARPGDLTIRLADWRAGRPLRPLVGHTGAPAVLRFTPAGGGLISASAETSDRVISLWDVARGEEVRRLGEWDPASFGAGPALSRRILGALSARPELSPDGTLFAAQGQNGRLHVVRVATGKELPGLDITWQGHGCVGFSPNGKELVTTDATEGRNLRGGFGGPGRAAATEAKSRLRVVDLGTGKLVREPGKEYPFFVGRLAVTRGRALLGCRDGVIRVVDLASGQEVGRLGEAPKPEKDDDMPMRGFSRYAPDRTPVFLLTPDGRTVAVVSAEGNSVRLLEVTTGHERAHLKGHRGPVQALGFAPDGAHLATGSQDGTLVVWAVVAPSVRRGADAPPLTGKELEALWDDLAGEDAARAFQGAQKLAGASAQAVRLLAGRLKETAPLDEKHLREVLRELDSKSFARRQKAERALAVLGEEAVPALEVFLKGSPSAEAGRRLGALLNRIRAGAIGKESLRAVRAVEILEAVGTAPARDVLNRLAAGAPGARTTEEARAALERLRGRAAEAR